MSLLSVIYKPTPAQVMAKFNSKECRCGHCDKKLGEFVRAEGTIACKRCGSVNIVKK